jgi:hypothetical protein
MGAIVSTDIRTPTTAPAGSSRERILTLRWSLRKQSVGQYKPAFMPTVQQITITTFFVFTFLRPPLNYVTVYMNTSTFQPLLIHRAVKQQRTRNAEASYYTAQTYDEQACQLWKKSFNRIFAVKLYFQDRSSVIRYVTSWQRNPFRSNNHVTTQTKTRRMLSLPLHDDFDSSTTAISSVSHNPIAASLNLFQVAVGQNMHIAFLRILYDCKLVGARARVYLHHLRLY